MKFVKNVKMNVELTEEGLVVHRVFTKGGVHPYDMVSWKRVDTGIEGSGFTQSQVEFPTFWSDDAIRIVSGKYFYTYDARGDNPVREDSLKTLLDRIVDTIARAGFSRGYFANEDSVDAFTDEVKYLMLHQMMAFNSPVWFNIGTPERQQASACFINEVHDNMDSIMQLATDEANIFKLGSGAGVNLSRIRAKHEVLAGGGEASGPVSFMKGYDSFAGVIKSGGKKRRAAKMVILNDDHPDVEEFIWSKSKEEKKAHDLIAMGHSPDFDSEDGAYASIFFQNANHSVRVSDSFMREVKQDGAWKLYRRTDGEVAKEVSAKNVFHQIAQATWECGDPGMQFDDTIHEWHTCKATGRQEASNPCSEYLFFNNTACNLASLNLLKYLTEDGFDMQKFANASALTILAQDILVSHADYPNEKIAAGTRKWRTLGLGYANLGALLMTIGYPYDSDAGRAYAAKITSVMCAQAYHTSATIAGALGPFDGFTENKESMLEVLEKHSAHDTTGMNLWADAIHLGYEYGFRNAQVTVLAPTGTIGFAMDCDTTGIEPGVNVVSFKRLVGGGYMRLVNRSVERGLRNLGYNDDTPDKELSSILKHIDEKSTLEGAPFIKEEHLPIFDCAFSALDNGRTISWKGHIDMMAAVQPFLSGAISKTVNLPAEATVQDVEDAYMRSWEKGLKAVAIYRDGCKQSQPVSARDNSTEEVSDPQERRAKLPETRNSLTHKFTVGGQKGYLTVGLYDDGSPGELFVTMNKEGSTISGLMDAFATAISIGLQYGAPLTDLVSKFKHTNFEPAGFTTNADIRMATSVVDYIFRWLELQFLTEAPEEPKEFFEDLSDTEEKVTEVSYDSPLCTNCGSQTQRAGACYACPVCGETTGCG